MLSEDLTRKHTLAKLTARLMGCLLTLSAARANPPVRNTSDQPPRKVIVGTVMQPLWVKYPGLQTRLDQLTAIVDRMQAQSEQKYGRGLDLAITAGDGGDR